MAEGGAGGAPDHRLALRMRGVLGRKQVERRAAAETPGGALPEKTALVEKTGDGHAGAGAAEVGPGKACDYLLRYWAALTAHVDHGQTRLDNNLVENAIRPSAIGKKNRLFIGHPDAGQRSAIIYSIVVSCQRHLKDPLAYLRDVLTRLPRMTNQDDLDALTPSRWTPA